jgi:hypothetical protein
MGELCLKVKDYQNAAWWRWVLTEADGRVLLDHEVRLDPGRSEFEAFADLAGYLRMHVIPDRRAEDEARIIAEVGEWIGTQVFGPVAPIIAAAGPVTVRVIVPESARELLLRPLELAHVDGSPIALQDVTLVMQTLGEGVDSTVPAMRRRLRVLGLFSLPTGQRALNLRQERQALVRLFSAIPTASEVRAVQYGVTRARLKEVLAEPEGWDLVHVSGHGAPGELVLEYEDGSPDPISGAELAMLLGLARGRLRLVTVSSCWSAATTRRQLLGLPADGNPAANVNDPEQETDHPAAALAADLARLGCAVLAMRYPVTDEFASTLTTNLYQRLASGASLPDALGTALREIVLTPSGAPYPAISVACPALFGATAAGLRLTIPEHSSDSPDGRQQKARGRVMPAERFVGRTRAMTTASAALAVGSGSPGVLFYGMPGSGKTACARELAYTHQHAFDALAWFKAPDDGREAIDSLGDFALTLENALPGLQIRHLLDDAAELSTSAQQVTRRCENQRLMIVIDNAESLLGEDAQWRDARWGLLITAICGHTGKSRLVLTSRRRPAHLDARLVAVPVNALSLDEALLLARELPHLAQLIDGSAPYLDVATARKLVREVLDAAQGHPKLLEIADGQATDPGKLRELLQVGDQAWRETTGVPERFFSTGDLHAGADDYLHVLASWTRSVCNGLDPGQRGMFGFLCCLEENDRIAGMIEVTWPRVRKLILEDESLSAWEGALADLTAAGLISVPATADAPYEVHPAVAETGRVDAGDGFQRAVDMLLASYWSTLAERSRQREAHGTASGLLIKSVLNATPYLLRLGAWRDVAANLEAALYRDGSVTAAAAARPILMKIAAAVAGTPDELDVTYVIARALERVDPDSAERLWRKVLSDAVASQDFGDACVATDGLARRCLRAGRLDEAVHFGEDSARYARQAGLSDWTEMSGEVIALTARVLMGQAAQVMDKVQSLLARMDALPTEPADIPTNEQGAQPWDVRERLLDAARLAAIHLGMWQAAIDLNAIRVASKRKRSAPDFEVWHARFGAYPALRGLDRLDEALALLEGCREVSERARDVQWLAQIFSALAHIEHQRGRPGAAVGLQREGLRYSYLARDTEDIHVGHLNLGSFHLDHGQPEAALPQHLAAAMIEAIAGRAHLRDSLDMAARDLVALGGTGQLPADVNELCLLVAQDVPGARLGRELEQLNPDPDSTEQVLAELAARAAAASGSELAFWDPAIAALILADRGDTQAAIELERHLASGSASRASLAAAFHRILAGERGPAVLAGLNMPETGIASRALAAISGNLAIPTELAPVMAWAPLLAAIVAAACGDAEQADRVQQDIGEMARQPRFREVSRALGRILDGDRRPELADDVADPTDRAIITTVLAHIR